MRKFVKISRVLSLHLAKVFALVSQAMSGSQKIARK
jgi:hypothetical protein